MAMCGNQGTHKHPNKGLPWILTHNYMAKSENPYLDPVNTRFNPLNYSKLQ